MKKLFVYLLLLLSMPVFSQVTRTVAESKIDSLLPDNSARQITPARLRAAAKILLDYAESLDTASVQIGNRTVKGMLDVQRGPLSIKMGGYWNDTTRSTGQYNGGMIGVSSYYPGTQLLIMGSSLASGNFIKVGGGEAGYMAANLISEYTTATPGATIGSIRRYVFGSGRHWFGSSPVDDGVNLVTVNGPANIKGDLTTQNIVPASNATQDIGSSVLDFRDIHAKTLWSGSSLYFGKAALGDIFFRNSNSSNQIFSGFFGTTGNYYLQSLGVRPVDNGFRFQNYGTSYLGGDVAITGTASFSAPWSNFQATFGGLNQGGRIQFLKGNDGTELASMGATGAVIGSTFRISTALSSNIILSAGQSSTFTQSATSGVTSIAATGNSGVVQLISSGTSGTVRLQTGATERVRIHPDGAVTFDPSGAHVNTGLYTVDNIGNMRTTGSFTVNDGVITKDTGGQFTFYASVSTGSFMRANSGIVAGSTGGQDGSSIIEARSTSKGVLPSRMSEAQKNAIATPATGLFLYQLDGSEGLWIKTSTGWKQLAFVP